ncbi:MAG: hypothetical protein GYA23_09185 [Methanomicrobiales archaeon]|nr:hypothetical protein [Methanomicrobiales archaeon]
MQCSKCRNEAVIFQRYSGQHLCSAHFVLDFEARAKRVIRQNQWMRPGDRIAVLQDGSAGSAALLWLFLALTHQRKDLEVSAFHCSGTAADARIAARDTGFTRLACATALGEQAALVLTDILNGRADRIWEEQDILPVITPFAHIPQDEIALYARIRGIPGGRPAASFTSDPLFADVLALLADYGNRHPAAPYALLNLAGMIKTTCHTGREGPGPDQ